MSRERELLERVVEYWGIQAYPHDWEKLVREIRVYLAKPTQDEEPVAWTNRQEINALNEECTVYMYAEPMEGEDNIPLYLHPAQRPEFVRLSEEEVNSLTYAPYEPYELICAVENRLVEKNRG